MTCRDLRSNQRLNGHDDVGENTGVGGRPNDAAEVGELEALLTLAGVVGSVDHACELRQCSRHRRKKGRGALRKCGRRDARASDHGCAVQEASEHDVHSGQHREVPKGSRSGIGAEIGAFAPALEDRTVRLEDRLAAAVEDDGARSTDHFWNGHDRAIEIGNIPARAPLRHFACLLRRCRGEVHERPAGERIRDGIERLVDGMMIEEACNDERASRHRVANVERRDGASRNELFCFARSSVPHGRAVACVEECGRKHPAHRTEPEHRHRRLVRGHDGIVRSTRRLGKYLPFCSVPTFW